MIENKVFRVPQDLALTQLRIRRCIVLGECLITGYPPYIENADNGCPCDFFLINNVPRLPELPPKPVSDYDFQVLQIPMRSILKDYEYFSLSYDDAAAYERLFEFSKQNLRMFLDAALQWNVEHGLLTFVWNFMVPQQNPMGRFFPRYDLRNMVHFVEKLNEALADMLLDYKNCYLFDLDSVIATFGRRYYQDDVLAVTNHSSQLTDYDFEHDQNRLEGAARATEWYASNGEDVMVAVWDEIVAMYRTLRQADAVKMVILDLDDTLWRGVAAEFEEVQPHALEGWPLGVVEALTHLRRRGVLLAVVSKNDEQRIKDLWEQIFMGRLRPEDFVAMKISWEPKASGIEQILKTVNLTPRSVLFIDDNPVERAAIEAAFPGIRTLGSNPLLWRRILLWSAETQVARLSTEAANRTEMVRAQIVREEQRQQLSRDDFLKSLDLKVTLNEIIDGDSDEFARAVELLNRTNQFNTTGVRRTEQECREALRTGKRLFTLRASDRFTNYGLVGVIFTDGSHIEQFAMSCRVIALDVEVAAMSTLLQLFAKSGLVNAVGTIVETPLNGVVRDLFDRCGFDGENGRWERAVSPVLPVPEHVTLTTSWQPNPKSGDSLPA